MDSSSRYFLRHSGLNGLKSQSLLRFCLMLLLVKKPLGDEAPDGGKKLLHAGNRRGRCVTVVTV